MSDSIIKLSSDFVSTPADYVALREHGPLVSVTLPQVEKPTWLVTSFEHTKAALNDTRFVRDSSKIPGQEGPSITDQMIDVYGLPEEFRNYFGAMVLADGDDHARMRSVLTRAFTAARVKALRPQAEHIARDLHTVLRNRNEADIIHDFASPLAGAVLCELMGIVDADRSVIFDYIDFIHSGQDPEEYISKLTNLIEHLKNMIKQRRSVPGDDLVSTLVQLSGEDGQVKDTDIVAILFLLVSTGIMPPTRFIADATLALLDHPDQVERLRTNPDLLTTTAIPELLRFTSSVPLGAPMYATKDLDFCGMPVKQGEAITPALIASNHDPAAYTHPERLDLGRKMPSGVGHLGLGLGAHYCVGASMARLIGEVVVRQLFMDGFGISLSVPRDRLKFKSSAGDGLFLSALPVRLTLD